MQQQKYSKAVAAFEVLEQEGVQTPELYMNLGHACFQAGQLGKAIFYTEKAFRLSPLDEEIQQNRQYLAEQAGIARTPDNYWLLKVSDQVMQLALLLFVLCSLCFLCRRLNIFYMEKLVRFHRFILSAAIFLLMPALLTQVYMQPEEDAVLLQQTAGKNGPSPLAKSIADLNEGEKVTLKSYHQGWYKVKTPEGKTAWVSEAGIGKLNL
ncbi:hypothetical protein C1N53_03870 [Pontibacter sp. SGAir0037]|nr:hypothetical protein C1N53_03870 [Pontibacter sp. SGAir0037]